MKNVDVTISGHPVCPISMVYKVVCDGDLVVSGIANDKWFATLAIRAALRCIFQERAAQ